MLTLLATWKCKSFMFWALGCFELHCRTKMAGPTLMPGSNHFTCHPLIPTTPPSWRLLLEMGHCRNSRGGWKMRMPGFCQGADFFCWCHLRPVDAWFEATRWRWVTAAGCRPGRGGGRWGGEGAGGGLGGRPTALVIRIESPMMGERKGFGRKNSCIHLLSAQAWGPLQANQAIREVP